MFFLLFKFPTLSIFFKIKKCFYHRIHQPHPSKTIVFIYLLVREKILFRSRAFPDKVHPFNFKKLDKKKQTNMMNHVCIFIWSPWLPARVLFGAVQTVKKEDISVLHAVVYIIMGFVAVQPTSIKLLLPRQND